MEAGGGNRSIGRIGSIFPEALNRASKNDFLTSSTAPVHNRSQRLRAPEQPLFTARATRRETLGSNPYLARPEVRQKNNSPDGGASCGQRTFGR